MLLEFLIPAAMHVPNESPPERNFCGSMEYNLYTARICTYTYCVWSCIRGLFLNLPAEEKPWPDKPLIYGFVSARIPMVANNQLSSEHRATITWLLRDTNNTPTAQESESLTRNVDSFDMFTLCIYSGECDLHNVRTIFWIICETGRRYSRRLGLLLMAFCLVLFSGALFFLLVSHHHQQQPFSCV